MSVILQIETATSVCSVALAVDGQTIALKEDDAPNIHASQLTPFISELMQKADICFADLDAIAVSMGPGSYTGLRIGVSTAKGLCFALNKPLIAIPTLKMMAQGFLNSTSQSLPAAFEKAYICPMIDARRMEVFTAVYDGNLNEIEAKQAKIIDATSFSALLEDQAMVFIGNGAAKCQLAIQHPHARFIATNFNSAAAMSALAWQEFKKANFEDTAYFEPFYLKDFVFTPPKKRV